MGIRTSNLYKLIKGECTLNHELAIEIRVKKVLLIIRTWNLGNREC